VPQTPASIIRIYHGFIRRSALQRPHLQSSLGV